MPTVASLPKYIPLSQAAQKLNMDPARLHDMVTSGRIEAVQLPDGGIAVSQASVSEPLVKEELEEYQQFDHLADETTWVSKAARDYDIPSSTISRWTSEGFIEKKGKKGQKTLLNAQDVAYCAFVYRKYQKEGTQGRRIFDDNGMPYEPKSGPFAR